MFILWVVIVPAENSDGICDLRPSGGHRIHQASNYGLVYGQIARFFVGLSVVKLDRNWHGNWTGLVNSELRQDHLNIAVLMDVNRVMLPMVFDVHAEIEGDIPQIMHPEPLLHLILDLPNQVLVSKNKEIIDIQNDRSNDYRLIRILKHEQSSVNTSCPKSTRNHEVLKSAVPNVGRMLLAMKRLSEAEYHLPRSLC